MRTPVHTLTQKKFTKLSAAPLQQWFAMLEKKKIKMKEHLAEDLFNNFYTMQKILTENPAITKLELLYALHPQLKFYYEPLFEQSETHGRYRNLPAVKLIETVPKDPTIQYSNARRAHEDWNKIATVKTDLLAGNVQSFKTLKTRETQELALSGFKKKEYAEGKLTQAVLTCLSSMTPLPVRLDLSNTSIDLKALKKVLTDRGKNLISLKLNHCSHVTDEIIPLLSKRCEALQELSLRNTSVSSINEPLCVTNLDLSGNPKIASTSLNSIMKKCTTLRFLSLADTQITLIGIYLSTISHLDLAGCKLETTFFEQLRSNAKHLKSLRINSPHIKELNLKEVDYLLTLDLSDSPNLTKIYSSKNEDGSFPVDMMAHQGIQVLRANNCPKLTEISIVDAKSLIALHVNNCALSTIILSPQHQLTALSIIEVSDNPHLQVFLADPTRVTRFMALNCHQIITHLNDALCRRLVEQVIGSVNKSTTGFASSALTVLLRFRSVKWVMQEFGKKAFFNISAPGVDARFSDLSQANFYNADLRGIKLAGANLKTSCWTHANMDGATLGELPFIDSHNITMALATNRAGSLFFRADNDGLVVIHDRDEKICHQLKFNGSANLLVVSPDDKRLAIAGNCRLAKQDDSDSSDDMFEAASKIHESDVTSFGDQYYIFLYNIDLNSDKCFQQIWGKPAHARMITALAFTSDGNSLISCSQDEKIKLFEATTGKALRIIADTSSYLQTLAIQFKGMLFAFGDNDGIVNIWNVKTFNRIKQLQAHTGRVQRILFTLDGQFLITAGIDKEIHIWKISDWSRKTLRGHKEPIECIALSPDNKYLCSADTSSKRTAHSVKVWNLKTGESFLLPGIESAARALLIDPVRANSKAPWVIQAACNNRIVRLLFDETEPAYIPPQHKDVTLKLDITDMDVDDTKGLTADQMQILEQRGAIHKSFKHHLLFASTSISRATPSDPEEDSEHGTQLTDMSGKDNL